MKRKSNKAFSWICLIFFLIGALCFYSKKLTFSSLWYDEAIEYWYSKVIVGSVPGGMNTSNMYERICSTFQPPLYNVIMHIWLKIADSEFGFRFAGVLITLISSIGIYLGIKELVGDKVALSGMALFLGTNWIIFYALECAEYNLGICCVSWTICFYIKCLKYRNRRSLICFFLFACMSVYSQYGAAFLMIGIYASLLIFFIFKDKERLTDLGIGTVVVAVIAVLPLMVCFLYPQLQHQGTMTTTHVPHVIMGVSDFISALGKHTAWMFGASCNSAFGIIKMIILLLMVISTLYSLFRKEYLLHLLVIASFIAWSMYYLAVVTSFYAYNSWSGNTGFCNKYGIFLFPMWLVVLVYGTSLTFARISEHFNKKLLDITLVLLIIGIIFIYDSGGYYSLNVHWIKDDSRTATAIWFEKQGYNTLTLVHSWSDPMFQFYLVHNEIYSEKMQEQIVTIDDWIKDTDYQEMQKKFEEMNLFSYEDFYYVGPNNDTLAILKSLMQEKGYEIVNCQEGISSCIYLKRRGL